MDSTRIDYIIPVSTAKGLQLAGGSIMEQAVPEEYVFASVLLDALEQRNGMQIEFFLKMYLPIFVIKSPTANCYAFIEQLGLDSGTVTTYPQMDFKTLKKQLDTALTIDSFVDIFNQVRSELQSILNSKPSDIPGLISGEIAKAIATQLDWPNIPSQENYSLTFPSMLDMDDLTTYSEDLGRTLSLVDSAKTHVHEILRTIENRFEILISRMEKEYMPKIERLNQRIKVLTEQIEIAEYKLKSGIGSSEKLRKVVSARKRALERDSVRRNKLLDELKDTTGELSTEISQITNLAEQALGHIDSTRTSLDALLVSSNTTNLSSSTGYLMIPFFVFGFTKKGQLELLLYPPTRLKNTDDRVGIRRDFVYPLFSASDHYQNLIDMIEKRISSDVSLRKAIRSHAEENNLLALSTTRALIREGIKSLLSDGLVKESKVSEIDTLLNQFPEISPLDRLITDGAIVAESNELCRVRFHICDESGKPIPDAVLELGALSMESDERGAIQISLPMSHYEGAVSAAGFHEKALEFAIKSTNDVVIPVVLHELSREDRIDHSLDLLVAKAERIEGIRNKLLEVFEKQGDMLLSVPAYRSALVELLTELGYDPESWISEALSKKGMVRRLLKRNDREDGMQRDILRFANDSRHYGGIMLFSELLIQLDELGWNTNSDEVEDILSSMENEGLIDGLTTLDAGARVVQFIPVALTHDPRDLLGLAAEKDGKLTIEDVVVNLEWTEERARNAFDLLVSKGVAKLQKSYARSTIYWFPGLRGKK